MPRSVAEIQAEIARVKQEIAARDMYRQPQTQVGWGSYIVEGDRGMLDAYQNREDQYNKMMKQQAFQAAEAALNRKFQEAEAAKNRQNALDIAKLNKSNDSDLLDKKSREALKQNMEIEMAQADYDAAMDALDKEDPRTALAAKRAAIKLNYALRGKYADDPQLNDLLVGTDYADKDSDRIANKRESNSLANSMDAILKLKGTKAWNEDRVNEYNGYLERMKEIDPERAKNYETEKYNKGASLEDRERAELKRLREKRDKGQNMTSREQKRLSALEAKYK